MKWFTIRDRGPGPAAEVHVAEVRTPSAVAISRDSRFAAMGSRDGRLALVNLATGALPWCVDARIAPSAAMPHASSGPDPWSPDTIHSIAFSPDGRRLAFGFGFWTPAGASGGIGVRDVATGQCLVSIHSSTHEGWGNVWCRQVAFLGEDAVVALHSLGNHSLVRIFALAELLHQTVDPDPGHAHFHLGDSAVTIVRDQPLTSQMFHLSPDQARIALGDEIWDLPSHPATVLMYDPRRPTDAIPQDFSAHQAAGLAGLEPRGQAMPIAARLAAWAAAFPEKDRVLCRGVNATHYFIVDQRLDEKEPALDRQTLEQASGGDFRTDNSASRIVFPARKDDAYVLWSLPEQRRVARLRCPAGQASCLFDISGAGDVVVAAYPHRLAIWNV